MSKRTFISILFLFIGFGVASSAYTSQAMVIRTGDTYSLESYTTLEDDLYVGAGDISLSGTTTGDVLAVGSHVKLKGVVLQDVFLLGGDATVSGVVEGDLRSMAGEIYVDGHITEDVFLAGGTVEIAQTAVIDGDLFIYADSVEYNGSTTGEVEIHGRVVQFKGLVQGNVDITARESVSVLNMASIKGDLIYSSPREVFLPNKNSIEGSVQRNEVQTVALEGGLDLLTLIARILMTVIASVLFVYIFPKYSRRVVDIVIKESPWSVAKGGVVLLAWPIVAFTLVFSLLGILPGLLLFFGYGVTFVTAGILAPVVAGVILARWLKHEKDELKLAWVSLGAITFVLISLVTIVGVLIELLLFLFAFYAVCLTMYESVWKNRKLETEKNNHEEKGEAKEEATRDS